MKLLGEVLDESKLFLEEHGVIRPRRTAEELIAHLLEKRRIELYMEFDRPLEKKELKALDRLLERKVKGEPTEQILGEVSFYGAKLKITPDVLIPRPETEILLDKACESLRLQSLAGKVAWDICTGSGCLGIGLKKTFPELEVVISDFSLEAFEVAKGNAEANGIVVEILLGDLLAPFEGRKADIVLCNPPYISKEEYKELDASVREFEPKMALVGGLEFYERLASDLPFFLNPNAKVFLEIGSSQGSAVKELFSASCWKSVSLEKDWAGHDRFLILEFEPKVV